MPRTFIYFQRPNIPRFRANNLQGRDLRAFVTEFSSLNRSISANGGDVNYFIIGSLSLSLSLLNYTSVEKKCINVQFVQTQYSDILKYDKIHIFLSILKARRKKSKKRANERRRISPFKSSIFRSYCGSIPSRHGFRLNIQSFALAVSLVPRFFPF